uniref:hypothetical protein n=1 Tax=Micromonospora sp. NBC_00855 TaxID=2975978 RepID=UPI0037CADC0F
MNGDASEIAARLLAAAGDQPDRVKVVTGGKYMGFSVDDELAEAAGFVFGFDDDVVDLDVTPLIIDDTTEVPTEYTEVPPLPAPAEPGVEPVTAPAPAAVEDGQADAEPVTGEPVVEEPAPVEAEEPKTVEKPVRKTSRSK